MFVDLSAVARHFLRSAAGNGREIGRTYLSLSPKVIAVLALIVLPALASAQVRPAPPTLCVGTSEGCSSSDDTGGNGGNGRKKWNPGHYLKTQGDYAGPNQAEFYREVNSTIDRRIEDSDRILGAFVTVAWGAMNPTGNRYYWDDIDATLENLSSKSPPKRMILQINYKTFRGVQPLIVPADLQSDIVRTNSGSTAAIWRRHVMDRYIAALKAVAARYDSHPYVEIVTTSESASSLGGGFQPADYDVKKHSASLQRMYREVAPHFAETNWAPSINFLSNQVPTLMEAQYQLGIMTAEADIDTAESDEVFKGNAGAIRDYRGHLGRLQNASSPALGGKDDRGPPYNIIDLAQRIGTTHLGWVSGESSPNSWSNILAAIKADPTLAIACPGRYDGNCQ